MEKESNNWITWIVVIGLIYGGYSLISGGEPSEADYENQSNTPSYYEEGENDGYGWAEDNDISSFEECQDQFGTGYEEDECNRYVKEDYSGYSTFRGYDCTEDCSGHEAGYSWAEDNSIFDESDCDGNSNSFNEGCIAYVEENE